MLGSFVPQDGKVLVLANGAYGQRAAQTIDYLGRDHIVLDKGDYIRRAAEKSPTFWPLTPRSAMF